MRKFRRRYIVFQIVGESVEKGEVVKFFSASFDRDSARQLYLKLIFYEENSGMGLLRCGHKHVENVKKMISGARIGNRGARFIIVGVSGTIKSAKRKYFPKRPS